MPKRKETAKKSQLRKTFEGIGKGIFVVGSIALAVVKIKNQRETDISNDKKS